MKTTETQSDVGLTELLGIRFTFEDACDIVYANRCQHEWYQGKCIHCEVTPGWARSVMEANARLGVEHNRTVDAERKNAKLLAEVERLRAMMHNSPVSSNSSDKDKQA